MELSSKYFHTLLVFYLAILNQFTTSQRISISQHQHSNVNVNKGPSNLPDLSIITNMVKPEESYSSLNPRLQKAVAELTKILRNYNDAEELNKMIQGVLKDKSVNSGVAVRGCFRTILTRDDRDKFDINPIEAAPGLWFSTETMTSISSQLALPNEQRQCVRVDGTSGRDNGPENILWYYREDPELNSNHWNWHLVYPFDGSEPYIDRRGELFYYFHHGVVARYHSERLSNFLLPISRLNLIKRGTLREGYKGHLTESNSQMNWADRPWEQPIPDVVNASFANVTMDGYLMYRQRIFEAIDSGSVLLPDGSPFSIRNINGTNILGDMIEASAWSINPDYYGALVNGIHNEGHVIISSAVNPIDPQDRFTRGLMSDTATAMRDLIFYRWHLDIDEILARNKYTLPPYQREEGEFQLSWPGVFIDDVHVRSKNSQRQNQLFTFWSSAKYTLRNGIDFQRTASQGPVGVCVKHLNHEDFEYRLKIKNTLKTRKMAAVRIFMAPRRSERRQRYSMKEQHELFFVMDTFSINLKPGDNFITRQSIASTLTIPSGQAIDELNNDQNRTTPVCACGFPHHLLLPKGKPAGMEFDLFAMVTEEDASTSIPAHQASSPSSSSTSCKEAYLYCGSLRSNKKYPDNKPMGYPFDRLPYDSRRRTMMKDLHEFVIGSTNMISTVLEIFHINKVKSGNGK